jgi:hypothetical protein
MENRNCPTCGATWIDGQLYWATGKTGRDIDLAALVCNRLPPEKVERCVNPCKGQDGGIGWEERMKIIEQGLDGL